MSVTAEVRLARDEHQRHGRNGACDQQVAPADAATTALGEELRQHERQRRLGEFGRLQVEGAEIDPAPRPAAHDAEEEHVDEQENDTAVDEVRLVGERAVVDRETDRQRHQPQHDAVDLRDVDAARATRGAVDVGQPHDAQRHQGDEHRPVDVEVQAPFEHYSATSTAGRAGGESGSSSGPGAGTAPAGSGSFGSGRPSILAK
jgi:hypothetical protein